MFTTPNRPTKPASTNAPPRPDPRVFLHIGDEIVRNLLSFEFAAIRDNSDIALPPPNLKRRRI